MRDSITAMEACGFYHLF